jgi:putative FmdB family regulatory protein
VTKYTYFCERCGSTFEVEIENEAQGIPPQAVCPKCEFPRAVKFFAVGRPDPSGGCTPSSGC